MTNSQRRKAAIESIRTTGRLRNAEIAGEGIAVAVWRDAVSAGMKPRSDDELLRFAVQHGLDVADLLQLRDAARGA